MEIDTPALLVDLDLMEANITRMNRFLAGKGVRVRPHYKTHKTPAIAIMQLEAGAIGITCAKVEEAETLVFAGVKDILIANEIVGNKKIARLAGLARYANLMVAVDDPKNIEDLSQGMVAMNAYLRVLVDINVGMNRCGVEPERAPDLARLVAKTPNLVFAGVMGYEGHCQTIKDPEEKRVATRQAMERLLHARDNVESIGLEVEIVSCGGTGTHAIDANTPGITEIQAGSYVFMDRDYRDAGIDYHCALTVLGTVISKPSKDRAIADVGLKGMSTDHGLPELIGVPGGRLLRLSEEHALIDMSEASKQLEPGDKVEFIPGHCCTTANLHDKLYGVRNGRLEVVWPIVGRGKFR